MQTYQIVIAIIFVSVAALVALSGWYTNRTGVVLAAGGLAAMGLVVLTILGLVDPAGDSGDGEVGALGSVVLDGTPDGSLPCTHRAAKSSFWDFVDGHHVHTLDEKTYVQTLQIDTDRCYPSISSLNFYMHKHSADPEGSTYDSRSTNCWSYTSKADCIGSNTHKFNTDHRITCEWKPPCFADPPDTCLVKIPTGNPMMASLCRQALGSNALDPRTSLLRAYSRTTCHQHNGWLETAFLGTPGFKVQCRQNLNSV